jgi:hypothetical protein
MVCFDKVKPPLRGFDEVETLRAIEHGAFSSRFLPLISSDEEAIT